MHGNGTNNFTEAVVSAAAGSNGNAEGCAAFLASVAAQLAVRSHAVGSDPQASSPFAVHAREAGHRWDGGKMDDVVVVLALVVDDGADINKA